jgi:hypothetical protein
MSTIPTYMTKKGTLTVGHGPIRTGIAASEIPFGAVVHRVADGTIGATICAGTPTYDYLGVAVTDGKEQRPNSGFYAAGKIVPYVASGTANVWMLGGQTIDAGDFTRLQFASAALGAGTEAIGTVVPETTPAARTLYSMGRVLDMADSGSANYKQNFTAISNDLVTFGSSTIKDYLALVDGDYLVLDSDNHAEFNMVEDSDYSSTQIKLKKAPLAHSGNLYAYKLTQVEIQLI